MDEAISSKKEVVKNKRDTVKKMKEIEFAKKCVKPFLEDKEHTFPDMEKLKCKEFNMKIDLISFNEIDNVYYYSEVKRGTSHHRLQTAIGQLFSHKFCNRFSPHTIKYQIVFPKNCESDNCFSNEFIEYLEDQMDIDIIFV